MYLHDPFDCPDPTGEHCETARRRHIVRARLGIPGLSPKREASINEFERQIDPVGPFGARSGEPTSLVDQSNKVEHTYLGGGA